MSTTKYRLLVFTYCILILLVSSIPGKTVHIQLLNWDKFFHFIEYSILGWLLIHSLKQRQPLIVFGVLAGGIIFGAFDEGWQQLISDRSSSILDWCADTAGIVIGGIVSLVLMKRKSLAVSNYKNQNHG